MKIEVTPSGSISQLKENLEKEFSVVEEEESNLVVEADNPRKVAKRPGVAEAKTGDEIIEGVKGNPLNEQAICSLNTKKDAVKALIATIDGYRLIVKETERQWDLKRLREYNPNIKEIKGDFTELDLGVSKSLDPEDELETVDVELGDEWEKIYETMLT